MSAILLDGKSLAAERRHTLKEIIKSRVQMGHSKPELAVVLLGDDPASSIYVKNKLKSCEEVGIQSHHYQLPESTSENDLIKLISTLNNTPAINGILIQLPLPKHINTTAIIEHINPNKDVDGFHPFNIGRLAQRIPLLRPCTPLGIIHLLEHYQIPVRGQHAVVIGASNIVGRPMSLELLLAGATVTSCHRFTHNLKPHIQSADILVVATGKRNLVKSEWLSKHQVLVDVGIHRLSDGSICGDVDFKTAREQVGWITPVPGGVGPMTVATLLENTCFSFLQPKAI